MRLIHRPAALLFAVAAIAVASLIVGLVDPSHAAPAAALFDPVNILLASPALVALNDKRSELVAAMRAIIETAEAEDRDLTAEEQADYDKRKSDLAALDARIKRLNDLEATTTAPVVPGVGRRQGSEQIRAHGEARREFDNLGEFLAAVRFNPNDQRLNYVENAGADGEHMSAEMRMDNNTSGGFMVPPQLRTTIMQVQPQGALVRPRAQVIEAGDPPDAGVIIPALNQEGANPAHMFGGVEVKWIEEGGEKPETDAELRQIALTPHEVAGFVTVTDKFLRNWQAASSFIENLLRGAVTAAEDHAFMRGSGVGQPLGAINSGAARWHNRAVANQVNYDDLVSIVARLLMRAGTSPVWSIPQGALPQLAKLTDPEGHYIWKPNAVDGFAGNLMGYPVRWNNRAPLLGQKGDLILADWSHYLIKDGSGPFVATSEHVKFTSNKTLIKIFWNVDGAPWLTAPIKEENGYEVSPFVGLDVPAG